MKALLYILMLLALVAVAACDVEPPLPAMVQLVTPPVPQNFTVTTQNSVDFDLDWTISDPTLVVKFYRVYTIVPILDIASQTFVDTIPRSSTSFSTQILPIPGTTFGVSSVTDENVESTIVFEPAF